MSNRISNRTSNRNGATKQIRPRRKSITTLIEQLSPRIPQYHKSHRYSFSFTFKGKQPVLGKESSFGRYGTLKKYKGIYPEYKAIVFSYTRALLIWIKHPKGKKTVEQLIEARKLARQCAKSIAFKYRLTNLRAKRTGYSEHTVENKRLDKAIRPLIEKEPKLMKERCGITINKTSHKNKIEHTDRDHTPEKPRAKDRVMELEDILYGKVAKKDDITELRVLLTEILNSQKMSMESTKELNKTIQELISGSMKPPEKPGRTSYI